MAQIILTIPDDQATRVVDALCATGGFSGSASDKAARRDFARGVIASFVRQTVMQAERQQAVANAMAAVTVTPVTVD